MKEPIHLPLFAEFLACWYHQDTWLEFDSDEAIWAAAIEGMTPDDVKKLCIEINALVSCGEVETHEFIQQHAESLYSATSLPSLEWANLVRDWLIKHSA